MEATTCDDRSRPAWLRQSAALRSALLTSYLPALFILAAVTAASRLRQVPLGNFTRDPVTVLDGHWYVGALSNLGCLIWASAAAISFFAFGVLRARSEAREERLLLLWSGLFTLWLCFDDLYLLHERVLPGYLRLPEEVTFAAYGLAALAYIIRFRLLIFRSELAIPAIAFGCFALSILSDATDYPVYGHYLVEDGFKFLGIVGWFTFLARLSYQALDRQQRSPSLVHQ